MSNVRALLSLVLAVPVAACGDDGGGSTTVDADTGGGDDAPVVVVDAPLSIDAPMITPDAPLASYDFSCLGNSAPTTAAANVALMGFAREITGTAAIQAASGVTITACLGDCQDTDNLGTVTTTASGDFTTPALATGGEPLDGHLRATKSGNWPTRLYPASPIVANQAMVPVLLLQEAALSLLPVLVQTEQSSDNGIVAIFVTDCVNEPIAAGATVSFTQGGAEVGTVFNAGALTSQAAGGHIAFNVPPGDTTVSATYDGMQLRTHVVPSVAGTVTTTQVRPGY